MRVGNNFRIIEFFQMFRIKLIDREGEGQGVTSFFGLLK